MQWRDQVPGCFGSADVIFAGHPLDEERAKGAIKAAKAAGANKDDFLKELVWHTYQHATDPNVREDRFLAQAKKLEELW